MIERTLTYDDLLLSIDEIYAAINPKGNTPPDEQTRQEVESLLTEIKGFLHPRLALTTTALKALDAFQPGRIIQNQLKGSEALCWFVATAGQEFETFQHRLMQEGDMVRVYLANEIGSLLAEKTADRMEEVLDEQILPKGLHHTNRFSPGYCGWLVKEQTLLFDLFPQKESCGIHLTDSCLMIPIKSVSGVIGIGHNVKRHDYSCGICKLESCYKRRIGNSVNQLPNTASL